ncbi:BM2 protein, partial [Influenza B virus (B/New York/WC-LVD-15-017/2015)]
MFEPFQILSICSFILS